MINIFNRIRSGQQQQRCIKMFTTIPNQRWIVALLFLGETRDYPKEMMMGTGKQSFTATLAYSGLMLTLMLLLLFTVLTAEAVGDPLSWVRRSDMHSPRYSLAAAQAGGLVYATGGNYKGFLNSAEVFLPGSNDWTPIADMPFPRMNHGAAGYGGKLYVLGGQYSGELTFDENSNPYPVLDWLSKCSAAGIYDPGTDSWSIGTSMPTPRYYVAVAELNGEIWVIGGVEYNKTGVDEYSKDVSSKVEIYDPEKNSWRTGSPFPGVRTEHAATSLDGKIYVSGGTTTGYSPEGWPEARTLYCSSGHGWTRLPDMPFRRRSHAMAGYQGKLFILGGQRYIPDDPPDVSGIILTSNVIEFSPATNSYRSIEPMQEQKWYHDAVQANGTIYTIGGKRAVSSASADILDNTESGDVPTCSETVGLFVTLSGDGTGKVVSSPGINCGTDCDEPFCSGTPVTITAVPETGSVLTQWTGECTGTDPSCTVEMNGEIHVAAVFSVDDTTVCPDCSGSAVSLTNMDFPPGMDCTCVGTVSITVGSNVTIPGDATVTFQAPSVTVQPEFHPEKGAGVHIKQ